MESEERAERRHGGVGDPEKGRRMEDPQWAAVRQLAALKKAFGVYGTIVVLFLALVYVIVSTIGKGSDTDKELLKQMVKDASEDRKALIETQRDLRTAIDRAADMTGDVRTTMESILTISRIRAQADLAPPPVNKPIREPPPKTLPAPRK